MLTSILELGAWVGTLFNGYLADALGRRVTVLVAVVVFCVGVIVQACTVNKDFVLGGRFVTGLGVGSLSMIVPLYNAELVSRPQESRNRKRKLTTARHHQKSEDPSSPCSNSPSPLEL
jgi:MFS family permease